MRQDEDIFHISDKRSTQRAIQFSVFMTMEKLRNYYNNDNILCLSTHTHDEVIPYEYRDEGDISKRNHWTEEISENQIIYWLSAIVSQSGWDLGFKHPDLNVECIFHEKFRPFLKKIGLMPYIGNCVLCAHKTNKQKVGWKKEHMYQHFIAKKGWLHDMLGFYCHHRYDNIDAKQFAGQKPFKNKSCTEGRSPFERFCIKRYVDICPGCKYEYTRNKF
jgi:hypothetical protein